MWGRSGCVFVCVLSHSAELCFLTLSVCTYVSLQYESSGLGLISSRLRTTLNRIQESLIDMVRLSLSHSVSFPVSSSPVIPSSLVSFSDTNMLPPSSLSSCTSLHFVPLFVLFFFLSTLCGFTVQSVNGLHCNKCIMGCHYLASGHSHTRTYSCCRGWMCVNPLELQSLLPSVLPKAFTDNPLCGVWVWCFWDMGFVFFNCLHCRPEFLKL